MILEYGTLAQHYDCVTEYEIRTRVHLIYLVDRFQWKKEWKNNVNKQIFHRNGAQTHVLC